MSLTDADVRWLIVMDNFTKLEHQWNKDDRKSLISPILYQRIDILFRVIRRFLSSVPHTNENRRKFFRKMEELSFLTGTAEAQMGTPLDYIYF
jgi:hypothetical protein